MQELKQLKDINTDGVTESRRGQGFFGITGVKKACKESAGANLGELASAVCKAADRFHDPHLPPDDRLVLATRISRPAERAVRCGWQGPGDHPGGGEGRGTYLRLCTPHWPVLPDWRRQILCKPSSLQ